MKNRADSSGFNHRAEGFREINTLLLKKPLCDKASFEPIDFAIRFVLYREDPFTANNILMRFWWHKLISSIPNDRVNLIEHGFAPARIMQRLCYGGRDFGFGCRSGRGKGIFLDWFCDFVFASGAHGVVVLRLGLW